MGMSALLSRGPSNAEVIAVLLNCSVIAAVFLLIIRLPLTLSKRGSRIANFSSI